MPFEILMGDDAHGAARARTVALEKMQADLTAWETQIGDQATEIQEAAVSIVVLARHVRRLFVAAIASPVVVEALIHLPGWLRHA